MKKKSTVLILLLALSMISMIPMLSVKPVAVAEPVTYPSSSYPGSATPIIKWYTPTGYDDYLTLAWNPEYLTLHTIMEVPSQTTVIIQGKDVFGQNIEASVFLNGTCDHKVGAEQDFIFNDTHSGMPVAFAAITGIYQQNGTHNCQFLIKTQPEPFYEDNPLYGGEYLGEYHNTPGLGWLPGQYRWGQTNNPAKYGTPGTKYLVGHGAGKGLTIQDVPVEPSNPDPLKVLINWHETDGDLYPDSGDSYGTGADNPGWLWIEGLDERGNKVTENFTIPYHASEVDIPGCTYSTICKVLGNATDSYYILTKPMPPRVLFTYTILIDHITIHPECYDILAYPYNTSATEYPGVTNVTIALRDHDGNLVHAAANITVNFATSGGKIQPSCDIFIQPCHVTAMANLTADTNARTVNVTADANVPACTFCPALNLFAWTEMTFDGINSVLFDDSTPRIHTMMWGWNSWNGTAWFSSYTGPIPPKPWLPPELGGPSADSETGYFKLDGPIYEVMIPLYTGCNLISCPVHPFLCNTYYCHAYPTATNNYGIPMDLLFGRTSATTCIEAVWWYCDTSWHHYVPTVDAQGSDYFHDGVGYWIKAEKPCTLEISGV
jgi:hypothetical protein